MNLNTIPHTFLELIAACACLIVAAAAQTASSPAADNPAAAVNTTVPDSAALANSLAQIEQMSHQTSLDVARLRIEKWRVDSSAKKESQSNADSLVSNLTAALPEMINAARQAPASMAPGLKLYRDLNVLYDVLSSLAESAGAFGPKDDYRALAGDTESLDAARRSLADYLESLAAARDAEIARFRAQSAANNASVAKRIVDDTQPVKKPVKRKKSAAKSRPAPAPAPQ